MNSDFRSDINQDQISGVIPPPGGSNAIPPAKGDGFLINSPVFIDTFLQMSDQSIRNHLKSLDPDMDEKQIIEHLNITSTSIREIYMDFVAGDSLQKLGTVTYMIKKMMLDAITIAHLKAENRRQVRLLDNVEQKLDHMQKMYQYAAGIVEKYTWNPMEDK